MYILNERHARHRVTLQDSHEMYNTQCNAPRNELERGNVLFIVSSYIGIRILVDNSRRACPSVCARRQLLYNGQTYIHRFHDVFTLCLSYRNMEI